MAEVCPICFREVTVDPRPASAGLCSKRAGGEQWRRTECFNRGISARNEQLAAERALNERPQARVEELEKKIETDGAWEAELAMRSMSDG